MKANVSNLYIKQKTPLSEKDTKDQTHGCRHTNPDICSNNSLENVCAFVSEDQICKKPPRSWKKIFENLRSKSSER